MLCPKCGASQEDGRTDCSACGIIFSRWRPSPERQTPRDVPQFAGEAGDGGDHRIPLWALAIGIAFLLVFGVIWTAKRHAARASGADTAELHRRMNEINHRGLKQQAIFEKESAQIARAEYRASAASAASQNPFPAELIDSFMVQMVGECSAMKTPVIVSLPKTFVASSYDEMLLTYPSLFAALRDGYAVLDPPLDSINSHRTSPGDYRTIEVKIPITAYSRMLVSETGDHYDINLGKRVVDEIRSRQSITPTAASMSFSWRYEQMAGESLGTEDSKIGGADFERQGSFWKARRVWLIQKGQANTVCGD